MFFDLDLRGDALPLRTLCLTYDDGPGATDGDGPGPQTAAIGRYLAGRGIAATFFVVGRHVREHPGVVAQLRAGGHLVANHTDTHPTLVSFHRDGGDVVAELARADEAIGAPAADGELTFFRAPYGFWRDDRDADDPTTSSVAAALNRADRFPHLVGPVGWDVDGRDWDCWRTGADVAECGRAYLDAVEAAGRGIVLLHDGSESPALRDANRTAELTRWLVPELEGRGYRFVRLDEVPGVASAARVARQVAFGLGPGRWLTCPVASTRIELTDGASRPGGRERFGVVPLGPADRGELVSLRAWNGRYLMRTTSADVVAEGTAVDDSTRWLLEPAGEGRVEVRSTGREALGGDDHPRAVRLGQPPAPPLRFALRAIDDATPVEPE